MHNLTVSRSKLFGTLHIPPSKSHAQRALVFALMAKGKSHIHNLLASPDIEAMLKGLTAFGAKIKREGGSFEIEGGFSPPKVPIDAENSGQVLRFLTAVGGLLPSESHVTGDKSIQTRRPITPLLNALEQLGAKIKGSTPPFSIQGPIHPGKCHLNGEDSQPVSALLMALSFLEGSSEIFVKNPGETPWIELTLDWLKRMGALVTHQHYSHYQVQGGLKVEGFEYTVPADYSSAAFPLAAALGTGSNLKLVGLDPHDIQGDKKVISLLQQMNATIDWEENTLVVKPSKLTGQRIDINPCIDALPIFAVIGTFAKGKTTLYNGSIARYKESDRISAMAQELKKMGATIEEHPDGLTIHEGRLKGAFVNAHEDHRIALALSVAGLIAEGTTTIEGADWIKKSYPSFIEEIRNVGGAIELDLIRV